MTPVCVAGLTSTVGIAAFYGAIPGRVADDRDEWFCAVLGDGSVKCWGSNALGESDTSGPVQVRPVTVQALAGVSQVVGGKHFACALAGGTVACWGDNGVSQLGSGHDKASSTVPLPVSGLGSAVAIAAGSRHACALLSDASVQCWGSNVCNELGNDVMRSSAVPTPVF